MTSVIEQLDDLVLFWSRLQRLLWLRMIPDSVFMLGVIPMVTAGVYGLFHLRTERPSQAIDVWVADDDSNADAEAEREFAGVHD